MYPEIPRALAVYGADVHWVPADDGVTGAMAVARKMAADEGGFMLDQFCNPHNARAHYVWTGPEILEDVPRDRHLHRRPRDGRHADGHGQRLKEANPSDRR